MSTPLTVAVTGATGFVGREVVRRLLAQGHSVRALVRDTAKARAVLGTSAKLSVVQGHIHDGTSPAALITGADACINLIGIIREVHEGPYGGQTFERMHIDATRVLVDACTAAGVKRFIQMSALGVRVDGRAEYQRSKALAELTVRRSGLDWTIFRPGLIHGPSGELTGMIRDWVRGDIAPFWFVPFFTRIVEHDDGVALGRISFDAATVSPVSVDDVAEAFVRALSRPSSIGEIYNIVGSQEIKWNDMLKWFSDRTPRSGNLPILGLPGEPHIYVARLAHAVGLGALVPFDDGMPAMAQEDATADTTKLKAHLDLAPKGFAEVASSYVGLL